MPPHLSSPWQDRRSCQTRRYDDLVRMLQIHSISYVHTDAKRQQETQAWSPSSPPRSASYRSGPDSGKSKSCSVLTRRPHHPRGPRQQEILGPRRHCFHGGCVQSLVARPPYRWVSACRRPFSVSTFPLRRL
jgi:hypothetical protein